MCARKILVPTDLSRQSTVALEMAASLARARDAELIILHVEEPPLAYGGGEAFVGLTEPTSEQLLQRLEQIRPPDPEMRHEHRMVSGLPADTIVRMAEDEGVDMIVMSTHGRTGLSRMLMGSVAEAVVRQASCPVLTVKPRREKAASSS